MGDDKHKKSIMGGTEGTSGMKPTVVVDIRDHIDVHMVFDGDKTKGWVHTHGMHKFELPELEIRDVNPVFMMTAAGQLVNHIAQYMVDGIKPVKLGEIFAWGHHPGMRCRFKKLDPIPGDEEHFTHERWAIVDIGTTEQVCEDCQRKVEEVDGHVH